MKKRAVSFLLVLCMIVSLFSSMSTAFADTSPQIKVSTEKAGAGEEVTLSVSTVNNPGVAVLALGIEYDRTKLQLIGFEDSGLTGWAVNTKAVWVGDGDTDYNGEILKLKFKVLEEELGKTEVAVSCGEGDAYNYNEEPVAFKTVSGGVEIVEVHKHSYTSSVTSPTCTERGYTTHICDCGESYIDSCVAALGHDFKDGACARCGALASGSCGASGKENNVMWTLGKGGVLIISGEGSMADYSAGNGAPWRDKAEQITSVEIGENITRIGDYAFYGCGNISGQVVIPDNVVSIGKCAFSGCGKVTSLVIGEKVASISAAAFNKNTGDKYAIAEIIFKGETAPKEYGFVSNFNDSLRKVFVPADSYDEYVGAYSSYVASASFSTDCAESAVNGLKATGRFEKMIALSWQKHISDQVCEYVIVRNGEIVGRTAKCKFTDGELGGGEYTYEVYGCTADNRTTGAAKLTVSTAKPALSKIYSKHLNNTIAAADGMVYISAENNDNYIDPDGNEIAGKLYYLSSNGNRSLIGTSKLEAGSTFSSTLIYSVDWDVADVPEGEYQVVFSIEYPDGTVAEINGKINVLKTAPAKIINVLAVGDFSKIILSWSQSGEADTTVYKIYKKSDAAENFSLLHTINGRTTLTYVDTDVEKGTTYSYYVVALNSFGMSSEASEIAVAALSEDAEAPTVTKFTPSANSYITGTQKITVSAVDNLMPVKVKLLYSTNDGESWTSLGEDTAAPFDFELDTKALPDGKVILKAYAYDAAGNESVPLTCIYHIDNTGPEKVKGLSAKAVYASQLTLQWEDVSDGDVDSFILQQKIDGAYKTIASSIKTLGYNLSELYADTEYTYRVAAVDIRGNVGEYSDDFTVRTNKDETAPVVTSLVPNPSRHNNAIEFRAVAADDCGIKSIAIQVSTDRSEWKTISTANYTQYKKTATYAYTISLEEYSDCSLYVRAVAQDYSGNMSDSTDSAPFVEYIVDKSAPDKPKDLIASGGDGWIYISWMQGDEEDIDTYQLYRSESEDGTYSLIASNIKAVSYYDSTAQRDTVYYYKLRVLDTTGNLSDFSEAVSAKVADDTAAPEVVSINPASGSVIGPGYKAVEALVKDNNCLEKIVFEYKVNDAAEYTVLKTFENVGNYYSISRAELPIDEFKDGDRISIRVFATDIVGLTSEYSSEYIYDVDKVAPTLSNLEISLNGNDAKITWENSEDSDVSGYKVYRANSDGTFTALGSREYRSDNFYAFYDYLYALGDGDYSYKVEVYDKVGNYNSFFTDSLHYEREAALAINEAPVAKIDSFEVMEIGVEEFFDAGYSTDDRGIASYHWDFGDGTSSDEVKPIKKYQKLGVYTVELTVTDTDGETSTDTMTVTVNERTAVGTVRVIVNDEDGRPISNAPVYFDLGAASQKKINTDAKGAASMLMVSGDHEIGVYKNGYLPAQKTVTVLPNATRIIVFTIVQQELVTGDFEVKRMTFNEIKAAGIDVNSPANQNVYKVRVTIQYGDSVIPVTYVRNSFTILNYYIGGSGGESYDKPDSGSSSEDSKNDSDNRQIGGITFIPNSEDVEIIAVLDMPIEASYLKEFFDVRLHVINNAAPQFKLEDSRVHLDIPDGLTMMTGVSGDWAQSADVSIGTINGQETKSMAWILRGDKAGTYDLTANYSGTLAAFNEPVSATFKTNEPVRVYGLDNFKMVLEVCNEINYNAFYFNIGLENNGNVDMYNPKLNFDGIVNNITASTKAKIEGTECETEPEDFSILSTLLNVRYVKSDGTSTYIPFTQNDKGVITDIDTLAPGEAIYYEYAAYNMINFDQTAYFADAAAQQLSEYAGSFEVREVEMNLYNTANATDKFEAGLLDSDDLFYILNHSNYYYFVMAKETDNLAYKTGRVAYDFADLIFNFNWDVLTGDDRRKLAEAILLQLLVSQDAVDNVDDLVDETYLKAVKTSLSLIKSQLTDRSINYDDYFKEIEARWSAEDKEELAKYGLYPTDENGNLVILDEDGKHAVYESGKAAIGKWVNIIDGFLGNYETLYKFSQTLKKQGVEAFQNKVISESINIGGAFIMSKANWAMRDAFDEDGLVSVFANTCKYTNKVFEYTVLNPIKAVNEAAYNQAIFKAVQGNACIEEEMRILDAVISHCGKMDTGIAKTVTEVANNYKEIVEGKAYNYASDMLDQLTKFTVQGVVSAIGSAAIKEAISKLPTPVGLIYNLVSASFGVLNEKLKWAENKKCQDQFDIAACLSQAFHDSWNEAISDYCAGNTDASVQAIHALKYLAQTRLIGESLFKSFMQDVDEDYLEELNAANAEKGLPQYADVNEFYDDILKRLLVARDNIFTDRPATTVVKPAAPKVTFNYDTMTTNETFDSNYEYCLANGEWQRCSGGKIPVKLKTTGTVLRVRLASKNNSASGEITTVNILAQRKFSKVVSVKYDDGVYYFNNLISRYNYQVCVIDSEYAAIDWSKAITVKGAPDASVKASDSNYIAIRTCGSAQLNETVSKAAVLPVEHRQALTVNTWGNGEVTQSNESGEYFIGDEIRLTAKPAADAVFRGWFIGDELVSRDKEYILEMYNYASISAKFEGGEKADAESVKLSLVSASDECTQPDDTPEQATVFENSTAKLKAIIAPLNAEDKSVKWTSSDESVAAVDADGIVTFNKQGTVTISAETTNGKQASFGFTVLANAVTGICITEIPDKTVYYENEAFDRTGLTVIAKLANGKTEQISNYIVNGFDNKVGEKSITVSYEGFTEEFGISVVHKTQWQQTAPSTCTEHGTGSEICTVCGEVLETTTLPLKQHSYEWVVTKPSTADEDGTKEYVCKTCGDVAKTETLKRCDHTYSEKITKPTCGKQGYTTYTCTKCGYEYLGDYTDALEHDYIEQTVAPKCCINGYTLHTCKLCGDSFTSDRTEALEHHYTETVIAPTCTAEGYTLHTCENCGDSYKSDITDIVPHAYTSKTVAATCEHGGYTKLTCEVCGNSYLTDETEALAHNFTEVAKNGNCVQGSYIEKTCTECGKHETITVVEPTEHVFGEWCVRKAADESSTGIKYRVCIKCGEEETEIIPIADHRHTPTDWFVKTEPTCEMYGVMVKTCSECNEVLETKTIEATGHDYEVTVVPASCTEEGYTLHRCKNCEHSYKDDVQPVLSHTAGDWITINEPTCTEDGLRCKYCSVCESTVEQEVIPATNHSHTHWEIIAEADCTTVGIKKQYCDDCGECLETKTQASLGHRYSTVKTAADCEHDGKVQYICTVCGHEYEEIRESALGHALVHHDAKAPTCTEIGWEAYDTCSRCDYTTYKEIAATGHHYTAKVTAPTCTEKGYTTHTCNCGDSYVDSYVDALGHNLVHHEGKAATCTEIGWAAYDTCSRCDYTTYKEIPATGHHYTAKVIAPTCTVKGHTIYTCTCGDSYISDYVDALGHNRIHHDAKAPTCTEVGWEAYDTCSRCDYTTYKEIAATGHHYTEKVTAPTCTAKGYTTHTCACGNSYVDNYTNALGHSYKNGICTRCNAKSPSYVAAPVIKITTSAGKPKISWSKVDGATKYYVYRSTDGKKYSLLVTTEKTSVTNSKAKIGTTYYYKIKASKVVNGKTVYSAYSNVKSIKCTPAAPVVSISRSNGKPKLTWKAVTGASKYYIYRSTDGKTYKQYTTTTKTTYTNTGAASGKKYYYKVKAVAVVNKKNVFSAYSSAKNLMTTIATPTVSITTVNGKPKITWKAVTGADKYIVYRSTDGKTFKQLSTTTKTSLTNTGAKKNTKYYYKVKAVCTKNTSANSALSKAVSIKATK